MSQLNSNIPTYFGIAFAALATGFYLGQTIPQLTQQDKKKSTEKSQATLEEQEEELSEEENDYEIDSMALNDIPGEVRLALVVRTDLKMEKGKAAAQCAHAALGCYRLIATDPLKKSYNPTMTQRWLSGGQAKITLKCQNKEMMDELYAKALSLDVNACVIHDAGRTQIEPGSATVLGIGPAPKAILDQITGDLKLY
ncbi:Gluconate transport-inducing protein [Maudiozyma exigua]|uniref:peptidyl-tRNA hydrolase n=1 Tax=Maudiozyma exigua TaxID=34358 RepID=A0A9P6W1Y0_MAUEX|nr:Gluconate transport-inducing protein [Kazachstania exigua]